MLQNPQELQRSCHHRRGKKWCGEVGGSAVLPSSCPNRPPTPRRCVLRCGGQACWSGFVVHWREVSAGERVRRSPVLLIERQVLVPATEGRYRQVGQRAFSAAVQGWGRQCASWGVCVACAHGMVCPVRSEEYAPARASAVWPVVTYPLVILTVMAMRCLARARC